MQHDLNCPYTMTTRNASSAQLMEGNQAVCDAYLIYIHKPTHTHAACKSYLDILLVLPCMEYNVLTNN